MFVDFPQCLLLELRAVWSCLFSICSCIQEIVPGSNLVVAMRHRRMRWYESGGVDVRTLEACALNPLIPSAEKACQVVLWKNGAISYKKRNRRTRSRHPATSSMNINGNSNRAMALRAVMSRNIQRLKARAAGSELLLWRARRFEARVSLFAIFVKQHMPALFDSSFLLVGLSSFAFM